MALQYYLALDIAIFCTPETEVAFNLINLPIPLVGTMSQAAVCLGQAALVPRPKRIG